MVPAWIALGSRNKSVDSSQPLPLFLTKSAVENRDVAEIAGGADAAGGKDDAANGEWAGVSDHRRVMEVMGKPERVDTKGGGLLGNNFSGGIASYTYFREWVDE